MLLVERGRHPRFALGESSTPLANLALERLAVRYGFEDLWDLAAHGRWRRRLPEVGRGLKRGFCFYEHEPGEAFSPGPASGRRLVVAASPDDDAADNQWLRADVDRFLFERARAEGVDCREETAVEVVSVPRDSGDGPVRLRAGGQAVEAGLLIDATGGSPLAAGLGAGEASPRLRTSLVYSHFAGVAPFERDEGWPDSPFPERWSASHHLLEEGWMYQLRFDDGSVSAGFLLTGEPAGDGRGRLRFAARPVPVAGGAVRGQRAAAAGGVALGVAWRRDRAAGRGWLLLPHSYAFADPMFSTGIAWSLLAVERVADLCRHGLPATGDLERYGGLVAAEADHVDRLLVAAYRLMPRMERFTAAAMVYFAAASFDELRQRLLDAPPEGWCWQGFLGAGDGRSRLFEELDERSATGGESGSLAEWLGPAIERWNLIGLLDPRRCNAYPVDLEDMERRAVQVAAGLGLDTAGLRRRWPRLRSPDRMMEPV